MGRVDELAFEDVEEPAVVEKIRGPFRQQVAALDQDMLAAESVDHFGGAARVGECFDLDSGELLGFMHVRRDEQGEGKEPVLHRLDRLRFQ